MIGGAGGKSAKAEMRVSSIRGQVRWWHRKSNINPACNNVWGQTEPRIVASKISIALLPSLAPTHIKAPILPHDIKKSGNPRDAIACDQEFRLRLTRLVGCSKEAWEAARNAVKIWLLLGCIGLRANRAAGSVWPVGDWVPKDEPNLKSTVRRLGYKSDIRLADASIVNHESLSGEASDSAKLRHAASNTVSVQEWFGGIKPRKPSPLKMKVIKLGEHHRLLLTGLSDDDLRKAHKALGSRKPLGAVSWD